MHVPADGSLKYCAISALREPADAAFGLDKPRISSAVRWAVEFRSENPRITRERRGV